MNWLTTARVMTVCLMASSNSFAMEVQIIGAAHPEPLKCPLNSRTRIHSAAPSTKPIEEAIPEESDATGITNTTDTIAIPPESTPKESINWLESSPRRFGLWGDSHAAANIFSEGLIDALGIKDKQVLPGFIPPTISNLGVRLPLRSSCLSDGWQSKHAYLNQTAEATWSRALTRLSTQKENAYIWLDFRSALLENTFNTLDILLASSIKNLKEANNNISLQDNQSTRTLIRLSVNDDPEQIIDIDTANDNVLRISAQYPISTVKILLLDGTLGIDGFVPRYNIKPNYLFDTMGIPGATARGLQFLNVKEHIIEAEQPYDFVFIEFGTNEGNNLNFDSTRYTQDLRKSLSVFRQNYPNTACMLIGPTDRGVHIPRPTYIKNKVCTGKGKHRKCTIKSYAKQTKVDTLRYARIHATISQLQADIGQEFQCSAWSWQNAMGGAGGIYHWFYSKPSLVQRDLIHLTANGYRLSAQLFAQKLRKSFIKMSANANQPITIETSSSPSPTSIEEQSQSNAQ